MRKFIAVILAALTWLPFHAARAAEASDLVAQLQALKTEHQQLDVARAQLEKKKSDLEWAATQIGPKIEQYKVESAKLGEAGKHLQRKIAAHNGPCSGTSSDAGFVAACNGRAAQLEAEKAHYNQLAANLEATRQLLLQAVQTNQSEMTLLVTAYKKNFNRQREIEESIRPIVARLSQIAGQNDRCRNAIRRSPEEMHAECGRMFDGN